MFNHDAGHSHDATPYLVSGCPLCDAAKAARDQAIGHLAEAVRLLAAINPTEDRPSLRLNLGPIGITGDDTHLCRSIDLTAKQAEGLADAVDSMHAHLGSEPTYPSPADLDRMKAGFMEQIAGWTREEIPSGEWSASAVAQHSHDTHVELTEFFDSIDPITLLDDVLNSDVPGQAAEAYEQMTGEWDGEL